MRSCFFNLRSLIAVSTIGAALTTSTLNATRVESLEVRPGQFATIFGPVPLIVSDSVAIVPETVAKDLSKRVHRIDRIREVLVKESGFLRSADEGTLLLLFNRTAGKDELLRGYAGAFAGAEPPATLFANLDVSIDALWGEIARLAPTYESTPGHPLVRTIAKALEQRVRVVVPKATYIGGMMREKEWQVRLSAMGLPESRSMAGVVFYRLESQPWIVCREFELAQNYFKRNTSGPGAITFGCLRLQGSV